MMHPLDQALKPLLKTLPRRVFEQDRDQTWNLSMNGPWFRTRDDMVHVSGKVVPVYQSGWEGKGVWMSAVVPEGTVWSDIAALLIEDAKAKIMADTLAVSFTNVEKAAAA